MKFISKTIADTKAIAKSISCYIKPGDIILLNGDLGAGKTTLTKYLCDNWQVGDVVCSPSFTIIKEYTGKDFKIYHADLYRLTSEDELIEIGFEEILNDQSSVKIIEWPTIANNYLEGLKLLDVTIQFDEKGDRVFEVNINECSRN